MEICETVWSRDFTDKQVLAYFELEVYNDFRTYEAFMC